MFQIISDTNDATANRSQPTEDESMYFLELV